MREEQDTTALTCPAIIFAINPRSRNSYGQREGFARLRTPGSNLPSSAALAPRADGKCEPPRASAAAAAAVTGGG